MYDKIPNTENLSEEILCEILQFLQYKIRNKKLTLSDAEALLGSPFFVLIIDNRATPRRGGCNFVLP